MSVVTVQVGQCGNQIGSSLFSFLSSDANQAPPFTSPDSIQNVAFKQEVIRRYFTEQKDGPPEAKAVLVDMEEKVIKQCKSVAKQKGTWSYPNNSEYVQKMGSANNWALGYYGNGAAASENAYELCRKQIEQCDQFAGFLILMSLAGGTGSGLGAHITYSLCDAFPEAVIANHIVFPHTTGEVIVQNYNAVLTLSHLYQASDVIIGHQNDNLLSICHKLLILKDVSFTHINKILAHKLASVLQPVTQNEMMNVNVLNDLVQSVASHPAYKIVSVKNIPFINESSKAYSTYVWHALVKHMRQMLISDSAMEGGVNWEVKVPVPSSSFSSENNTSSENEVRIINFNKSVSNLLILRGKELRDVQTDCFSVKPLYSNVVSLPYAYNEWRQTRQFGGYEKSIALVSNSQTFIRPLDNCMKKAWEMFHAGAYLHQYEKYGVQKDDFVDSLGAIEQIISDYSKI